MQKSLRMGLWLLLILCFFNGPLVAQEEEWGEATYRNRKDPLLFLNLDRKPIIPNDNLIFGLPEFLDFTLGLETGYEKSFWMLLKMRGDYSAGPLKVTGDIDFRNDKKYSPAAAMLPSGDLGGFYFYLNEGGLAYDRKPLQILLGRYRNYDEVDSPYSLFINSKGLPANTMKFRWESNYFFYQTQWIGLNWNSAASSPAWNEYERRKRGLTGPDDWYIPVDPNYGPAAEGVPYGFPDRGVNFKAYGIKINDWRLGFLDAASYSGRPFDLEYLLNPIPMYFTQYFRATGGRPWATETNDNCLMGLFWDIKKNNWDAYTQVLVDDFSLGFLRFLYSGFSRNPWKAAWALGGRIHTPIGSFGLHHGGALKYTFEPIGTDGHGRYKNDAAATAYGYAFYPETRYYDGNNLVSIMIEDMMVGYKYGENNLAFQLDYQNTFYGFLFTSELELVLAGNNSPANPWQHYDSRSSMYDDGRYGSQLFGDGQIEKRLEWRFNVSRRIGQLEGYASIALGGRFNKLVLSPPDDDTHAGESSYPGRTVDNDIWIWKASNNHEFIFRISIGARYIFPIL